MKRVALLCVGLAVGAASAAEAQLTMQMSNGWSFTFSGNVNAFGIYENTDEEGGTLLTAAPGGLIGIGGKGFNLRTGLLPAFAVFDAKGKEGNTDLGVHFGFAPQIQCGTGAGSAGSSAHDCFGAQIDMRQVYLTVGGTWGQILAGREIGLFNRQNILTDQTLFGVGATGGINGGGTTLGRSVPACRFGQRCRHRVRADSGSPARGRGNVQDRRYHAVGERHGTECEECLGRRLQDSGRCRWRFPLWTVTVLTDGFRLLGKGHRNHAAV